MYHIKMDGYAHLHDAIILQHWSNVCNEKG